MLFELMHTIVCLDNGIIPSGINLQNAFSNLSEEDARKAKRKFRKLKRRIKRNKRISVVTNRHVANYLHSETLKRLL